MIIDLENTLDKQPVEEIIPAEKRVDKAKNFNHSLKWESIFR